MKPVRNDVTVKSWRESIHSTACTVAIVQHDQKKNMEKYSRYIFMWGSPYNNNNCCSQNIVSTHDGLFTVHVSRLRFIHHHHYYHLVYRVHTHEFKNVVDTCLFAKPCSMNVNKHECFPPKSLCGMAESILRGCIHSFLVLFLFRPKLLTKNMSLNNVFGIDILYKGVLSIDSIERHRTYPRQIVKCQLHIRSIEEKINAQKNMGNMQRTWYVVHHSAKECILYIFTFLTLHFLP